MVGGTAHEYASKNRDFIPREWLQDLEREDVVEWLGFQSPERVARLMRSALAVVLPSSYAEGCPMTLLEAASLGRAAIATRIPGAEAAVEHEATGLLVPPRDSGALADAMFRLLDSPELAGALGRRGRQRAEALFDIEIVTAAYERLYERARAGREPRE
jgi:glycosyltransferase involved in cell wall biosynthesis